MQLNRVNRASQDRICDSVWSRSLLSVASMKRQIGHSSRSFAPALRGLLTVLLTVAYVVVGIAGEIACASETLESADQIDIEFVTHPPKQTKGRRNRSLSSIIATPVFPC